MRGLRRQRNMMMNVDARPSSPAPLTPYTLGTEVGVPTGTTLTPTVGLPAADDTGTFTIIHPVTLVSAERTVSIWRNRSWSATLTVTPPLGATYLFENCYFENASDNWCVEVDETNSTLDVMVPLAIFNRCQFNGTDTCARATLAPFAWMYDCHIGNGEDAWGGAVYAVGIRCNIIAATDGQIDPHSDGIQISGAGRTTMYQCYISAGEEPDANSAFRAGTEFSAVVDVWLYYCGFDRGGDTVQLRGDAGAGDITGVQVVGCRWTGLPPKGLAGFNAAFAAETTIDIWTDNAFSDGTPIVSPV